MRFSLLLLLALMASCEANYFLQEPSQDSTQANPLNDLSRDPDATEPLRPWGRLDVLEEPVATVSWERAPQYMGKVVIAEGKVVGSHNSGRACFLNFKEEWRGQFHVVIFARNFADFPESPELYYLNKTVRVQGKVGKHRGAPQIVVNNPDQISVVE
ncbi:MAG: hypothetical protein QGH51_05435 [Planctomycetota bacterium]|jgi:hypothetical protein|nr:hypothetical protein [Planctomycetota bacterium]MDP6941456.1 hypothetical protein [Planctomycetota bacterium]